MNGYYDEALCLIRSVGEIANLLMLFAQKSEKYREWVVATKDERIKNFRPGAVRKQLTEKPMMPMDGIWYWELCEKATYVTPDTVPNLHNSAGQKYVGGIEQPEGQRIHVKKVVGLRAGRLAYPSARSRIGSRGTVSRARKLFSPWRTLSV
jgi:hypothetical protein